MASFRFAAHAAAALDAYRGIARRTRLRQSIVAFVRAIVVVDSFVRSFVRSSSPGEQRRAAPRRSTRRSTPIATVDAPRARALDRGYVRVASTRAPSPRPSSRRRLRTPADDRSIDRFERRMNP